MQRTTGELDVSQGCRRQHPRDRGANGDYGQHGHQRVARDEDEYKVGDDLYMHAHKIGTYMHMQICQARACMYASSHCVHMAYQRDGNVHDRSVLDFNTG